MSAEALAGEITELGMPYTRMQVTKLETGRREGVTTGELLAFAAVLEVAPAMLVCPVGSAAHVELLPHEQTDAWTAFKWFTGKALIPADGPYSRPERPGGPIDTYTWFDNALSDVRAAKERYGGEDSWELAAALEVLASAYREIRGRGWAIPPIGEGMPEDPVRAATEMRERLQARQESGRRA